MHESDTFLAILEEGEAIQGRKCILILGEKRIGPPDKIVRDCMSTVKDLERLTRMLLRALDAVSWQEILNTP